MAVLQRGLDDRGGDGQTVIQFKSHSDVEIHDSYRQAAPDAA
jgi:hypothetical protein